MSRQELFRECVKIMQGTDSPEFDAMCIFQDMLNEKAPLMNSGDEVSPRISEKILSIAKKRSEGYPLQYLLGQWEFYGYPFKVGEGVLIPRPDTETLVDHVSEFFHRDPSPVIFDLCSGSGCIAVTLKKELPGSHVYAVELSEKATGYLRENAALNNADIEIISGDVLDSRTVDLLPAADIIVCNPPYLTGADMRSLQKEVSYEPKEALFGGEDGLKFYREITSLWKRSLVSGGVLMYECGMGQHEDISRILKDNGFEDITFRNDNAGIVRCVSAKNWRHYHG